jgi:PAS domain-containing protein
VSRRAVATPCATTNELESADGPRIEECRAFVPVALGRLRWEHHVVAAAMDRGRELVVIVASRRGRPSGVLAEGFGVSSSGPWIRELGQAAVLRQLPVAVVVVEAGSPRIVESNGRARDMAERQPGGSMPEALEGRWEIFHPDGSPYALEERPVVRSMIAGEQVDGEEYFTVLADGSRLVVRSSSAPIYDDDGEIVGGCS